MTSARTLTNLQNLENICFYTRLLCRIYEDIHTMFGSAIMRGGRSSWIYLSRYVGSQLL